MKKTIPILLFLVQIISFLSAQCDDHINLISQAEIDAYPANYGCTTIDKTHCLHSSATA